MSHATPSETARTAEHEASKAAFHLGKAVRLKSYADIDTIVADFAMYQADHLINAHGFAEADRPRIERALRLHAQQGLAAPKPEIGRAAA